MQAGARISIGSWVTVRRNHGSFTKRLYTCELVCINGRAFDLRHPNGLLMCVGSVCCHHHFETDHFREDPCTDKSCSVFSGDGLIDEKRECQFVIL